MSELTKHINFTEAIKKAEEGDLKAMYDAVFYMCLESYTGKNAEPEINERYISYLKKLVDSGDVRAMIMLADSYAKGDEVPQDGNEAIRICKLAVKHGCSYGNDFIGEMYFKGEGVKRDYEKAYKYLTKNGGRVEDSNSFVTGYFLAEMYRLGLYVKQDLTKAFKWYWAIVFCRQYASHDPVYHHSLYRIGYAKHYGEGCVKNIQRAYFFMDRAKKFGKINLELYPGEKLWQEDLDREWASLSNELNKL